VRQKVKQFILKIFRRVLPVSKQVSTSLSGNEPPLYIEKTEDLNDIFAHIKTVWEHFGKTEPYWSVISSDNFRLAEIHKSRNDFNESGRDNVDTLFNSLKRNMIDPSSLKTCLEYGCGIGRVTYWLSQRFEKVIGYDISTSHIELAEKYLQDRDIKNVTLYKIRKPLDISNFPKVDLVYSVIVLQHNPPPIIRLIIKELLKALNPGGIAFLQVPTYRLGYHFNVLEYMTKEVNGNRVEMHFLPQNEIFEIIDGGNARILEVLEDNWIGLSDGDRSNTFIIQKN
jgi:SAM-dependent methyltransferase